MQTYFRDQNLILEERKTIKWFLFFFYLISILFDLFYDFVIPIFIEHTNINMSTLYEYWIYVVLFGLIPIALQMEKNNKIHQIKYLYFITYMVLMLMNDMIFYIGSKEVYASGNVVEVLWLLMSPVFVNVLFFRVVSIGVLSKYVVMGLISQSANVLFPILLVVVISIFGYILLNRFQAYVKAVKNSYDKQLMGIVKGIIATLELKDPYTKGHSERVAAYALVMAERLDKFSNEELKSFNYACLLHDIGKIHIPDQILMKPTSLTKEEYEIIKTHPAVGAQAISKVEGFKNNLDVILYHHERWDGKGYPTGLKGEEIPYLARVAAVADAFDAMTSSRSYRGAMPVEEAYKRIILGSGTQFDPELVEVFKSVYPSWIEISKREKQKVESTLWGNNVIDIL